MSAFKIALGAGRGGEEMNFRKTKVDDIRITDKSKSEKLNVTKYWRRCGRTGPLTLLVKVENGTMILENSTSFLKS